MKTELKTNQIKNIKKTFLSFYDGEDKKEKKHLDNRKSKMKSTLIVPPETINFLDGNNEATERIGELFEWREVYPIHEYSLDSPHMAKAKRLDGSESQFYKTTADSRKVSNEINLSLVLGQMFNTVYQNYISPVPYYSTGISANFGDVIRFEAPLDRNIFVKSNTYAFLPDTKEKVFHLDRGNLDMEELGIEAYVQTHLSCDSNVNDSADLGSYKFHKFLDVYDSDEIHREFYETPAFGIENFLKIPAGVSEFKYSVGVRGRIYSSTDFTNLSSLQSDKYGFAMLDLRNSLSGQQTPILRDPLGAWDKQPFGGVRFYIVLEFYEIESVLTV